MPDAKTIRVQVVLSAAAFEKAHRNYCIAVNIKATQEESLAWLQAMIQAEAERCAEYLTCDGIGPPIGTRCAGCNRPLTLYELHQRTAVQKDGRIWHRWCAINERMAAK